MARYLFYTILMLFCASVSAQRKQYVFTHITSKEGLAADHVYGILQDKKGFMWFATANGLQRYDGKKIISFRPAPWDTAFLPPGPVSQILLDKNNRFWVRMGRQIGLVNTANFSFTRIPIDAPSKDLERSEVKLCEDADGNVFLMLSEYGFVVYREKSAAFILDTSVINAPRNSHIKTFQQDPLDGNYWIGHKNGLALFHRGHKKLYTAQFNPIQNPVLQEKAINNAITSFFIDSAARLWIGNWLYPQNTEQFSCYDLKRKRLIRHLKITSVKEKYRELHQFTQQRNGKVWAYGLSMLAEYNESSGNFNLVYNEHPDDFGIKYNVVHSYFEDREQNVWIGTDQGIFVFNPMAQRFTSISLEGTDALPSTGDRSLTSFLQLGNGDILSASWGQGILAYDVNFRLKPNNIIKNLPGQDKNYLMVWSMIEHKATKKVWIGCQAGRLMIYDQERKETVYLNHPVFDLRTVRQLSEDKDGNIWFGTQHGRLIKWDAVKGSRNINDGFELVHTFTSNIFRVKPDKDGFIWVGTYLEGLFVLDQSGNIIANYNDKGATGRTLMSNGASDILFYNDSLVVVCASALSILNKRTGNIKLITVYDGLPSNTANTVQKDEDGNLWIGLINGLCRYNVKKNIFTLFSQKDGIVRNEFHNGSSYVLMDGRMIFSSQEDFIYFNPQQILPSSSPPDVSITDFKLFNTYLPPDSILQLDRVMLNHDQNSITIEFAALSFLQKDKMIYYIMMEGIDDDWTRVDRYNIANFTLLPPGDYLFKVKCENGDGIPSKNITSLKIHIRPPFWRQEWFILLCIFAMAGLIYLAHRMRVQQLMQMEKVRGRIARDLHDDMGSTLSTINILSEMAKMKVDKDTQKTSEYISKISDNSNRMMEAMDDIVWSINPMNDSMQRITARMREFATGVLEAKNMEVVFRVDEKVKDIKLDMEARRDFFLIFKEAVNNVAKYSQAKHAVIDINIQSHRLIMQIQDDGMGFDVQQADSGNGLTNMKKRAESLNGTLSIESVHELGTKVRLEAPLT
ncbi:MAG TPA: two-component regulator propeller domain-containing protein [Chitinophagaceae bacterium]